MQMEDDGEVLEFHASASDLLKGESPSEEGLEALQHFRDITLSHSHISYIVKGNNEP